MTPLRTFILLAFMISLSFMMSSVSAEEEYEFRFDSPVNGEGSLDPDSTLKLKVEIENYLDISHEFELSITNFNDLDSVGLEAWWSNDGQGDISSESTTLPSIEVPDNSLREGITVTIRATNNALYGTYDIELKCQDKDNVDPEGTKQLKTLSVSVNQTVGLTLEVAESGSIEGSIDVDSETTYQIKVNNEGNKEDTISLSYSSNDWDADFNTNSITIQPFSSQNVILTIETDSSVEYGDNDDITVMGTSGNSGDERGTLDLTTYVRVLYGLDLTATTVSKTGEPGDQIIFNFKIMNKWSENINFEITKKDWYRGTLDNKPDSGWSHTDGTGTLDAFEELITASSNSLKISISSSADAGEVVTVIVVAKVSNDNELIGSIETEIEVHVEGDYEIQLLLPLSDQINLDIGKSISTSNYIKVKNFAKVSDLITVTATWEIGGNDWDITIPNPFVIDASGEKDIYITVKAPDSAADNQAILKIRVTSGGDNTKFDEQSITFTVNSAANTAGPETEKLDEEGSLPIDPIWLVSIVLIIGLGSAAVFGLQQRSKGAFGGSEENTNDFSDEWAGMEGAPGTPPPQTMAPPIAPPPPPPAQAPPQPVAPPPAAELPPSMAAIPQPVAPPPAQAPPQPVPPPVSAPTILTVTVPQGVVAGQQIQLKTPTGQLVNVKVPEGCGPGSQFKIQI